MGQKKLNVTSTSRKNLIAGYAEGDPSPSDLMRATAPYMVYGQHHIHDEYDGVVKADQRNSGPQ